MPRRFPPPWIVTRTTGGWCVNDASGHSVAYVYGEDSPQGASSHAMTVDEAADAGSQPDLVQAW